MKSFILLTLVFIGFNVQAETEYNRMKIFEIMEPAKNLMIRATLNETVIIDSRHISSPYYEYDLSEKCRVSVSEGVMETPLALREGDSIDFNYVPHITMNYQRIEPLGNDSIEYLYVGDSRNFPMRHRFESTTLQELRARCPKLDFEVLPREWEGFQTVPELRRIDEVGTPVTN